MQEKPSALTREHLSTSKQKSFFTFYFFIYFVGHFCSHECGCDFDLGGQNQCGSGSRSTKLNGTYPETLAGIRFRIRYFFSHKLDHFKSELQNFNIFLSKHVGSVYDLGLDRQTLICVRILKYFADPSGLCPYPNPSTARTEGS